MGFIADLKDTAVSVAKVILLSKGYKKPDVDNGKPVFIFGNGPALKHALENGSEILSDAHVAVVNGFATSEEYEAVRPQSYFIKDGIFFWITREEMEDPENSWRGKRSEGETNTIISVSNAIKSIRQKTTWPLLMYVPFSARKSYMYEYLKENANIRFVFFNNVKARGFKPFIYHFLYSKGLANPQFQNVVQMAIFQKINEGFKEIYLSGINANFHEYLKVGDDNKVYTLQHHFYDKKPTRNVIADRDEKGNYIPQPLWKQFDSLRRLFYGFMVLKDYAEYHQVRIVNTSKESYIDAFERRYIFDSSTGDEL